MAYIKTYSMPSSAVLRINVERDAIDISPEYQRKGEIWTREKKQLLIDSMLNDYDLPKLYFHALTPVQKAETAAGQFAYALIDGRQRLEAIWDFIDGKFALADDFIYLADESVKVGGLSYEELASLHPKLKIRFDSFTLPIMLVETDDTELIDEMFSRLNEAVPLNAAEKRNALGGVMARVIREVAKHVFFTERAAFSDRRYQHREVAARLLYIEYSLEQHKRITDTKKPYLDSMVRALKSDEVRAGRLRARVMRVLDVMAGVFTDEDALLKSQAAVPIYYLVARSALDTRSKERLKRERIESFHAALADNRKQAEDDLAGANFELLEYDRLSQQGTNDAVSIKERVRVLAAFLKLRIPKVIA